MLLRPLRILRLASLPGIGISSAGAADCVCDSLGVAFLFGEDAVGIEEVELLVRRILVSEEDMQVKVGAGVTAMVAAGTSVASPTQSLPGGDLLAHGDGDGLRVCSPVCRAGIAFLCILRTAAGVQMAFVRRAL